MRLCSELCFLYPTGKMVDQLLTVLTVSVFISLYTPGHLVLSLFSHVIFSRVLS